MQIRAARVGFGRAGIQGLGGDLLEYLPSGETGACLYKIHAGLLFFVLHRADCSVGFYICVDPSDEQRMILQPPKLYLPNVGLKAKLVECVFTPPEGAVLARRWP